MRTIYPIVQPRSTSDSSRKRVAFHRITKHTSIHWVGFGRSRRNDSHCRKRNGKILYQIKQRRYHSSTPVYSKNQSNNWSSVHKIFCMSCSRLTKWTTFCLVGCDKLLAFSQIMVILWDVLLSRNFETKCLDWMPDLNQAR